MGVNHFSQLCVTVVQPIVSGAESTALMNFYRSCMLWEIDVCISCRQLPLGLSNSRRNKQGQKKR